jgi:TusA-related sulfurtransferase
MESKSNQRTGDQRELFLDITDQVCPLTFVKTKLLIERMRPAEEAEIRLRGQEPLGNVPRSVREMGHTVLSLVPEDADGPPDGVHRLRLRKEPR